MDVFLEEETEEVTFETSIVDGQEMEDEVVRMASNEHIYSVPTGIAYNYLVQTITHKEAGFMEQEQAVGETPGSNTVNYHNLPFQEKVISAGGNIERPYSDSSIFEAPKTKYESVALTGSLEHLGMNRYRPLLEETKEKEKKDPLKKQYLSSKKEKQCSLHSNLRGSEITGGEMPSFQRKKSSHILLTGSAENNTMNKKSFNEISDSNLQNRRNILQDSGSTVMDSKRALLDQEPILQDRGSGLHDRACYLQVKESSLYDVYSLVDMSGKKRYRADSDAIKKEGSGIPQRYTVTERPPERCRELEGEITKLIGEEGAGGGMKDDEGKS